MRIATCKNIRWRIGRGAEVGGTSLAHPLVQVLRWSQAAGANSRRSRQREEDSMSLVRLLGFTTLGCGCVVGRYREVATSREVRYVEEKGKDCVEPPSSAQSHGGRRPHRLDCAVRARHQSLLAPQTAGLARASVFLSGQEALAGLSAAGHWGAAASQRRRPPHIHANH